MQRLDDQINPAERCARHEWPWVPKYVFVIALVLAVVTLLGTSSSTIEWITGVLAMQGLGLLYVVPRRRARLNRADRGGLSGRAQGWQNDLLHVVVQFGPLSMLIPTALRALQGGATGIAALATFATASGAVVVALQVTEGIARMAARLHPLRLQPPDELVEMYLEADRRAIVEDPARERFQVDLAPHG